MAGFEPARASYGSTNFKSSRIRQEAQVLQVASGSERGAQQPNAIRRRPAVLFLELRPAVFRRTSWTGSLSLLHN